MNFSPAALRRCLEPHWPHAGLAVAYSGGLDSTVLLHAIAADGGAVRALHVHHGLMAEADAWAAHCEAACRSLGVPLEVVRVDAAPRDGESPEDAARRVRYEALEGRVRPEELVLTGHHADDQAETLLLQLLRGAGPRGLAAMPRSRPLGHGRLVRPLLGWGRAALADYAVAMGLDWVEDPSNRHLHLQRNFLRHEVLPLLRRAWPEPAATLGRAASLQAGAARILDEVAVADWGQVAGPVRNALRVAGLAALPAHRRDNLLHHAVRRLGLPPPAAAHIRQLADTLLGGGEDRGVVTWPGAEARRYDGCLWLLRPLAVADPRPEIPWDPLAPLEARHGRLESERVTGEGLAVARAGAGRVRVRWRRGGERCRPLDRRHGQSLKKLLQERRVPPWLRDRLPLVYVDEELAAVADLWVCAPFGAGTGEPGYRLHWCDTNQIPGTGPKDP